MNDATHICGICGALWIQWPDDSAGCPAGSWSLRSPSCGKCCDNAEMGLQIIPLAEADELAAELGIERAEAAAWLYADRQAQAERDARGNCGRCKHYRPDPEAGRRYFGNPNEDSGWCTNPAVPSGHADYPHADMLSGDWCEQFEERQ